MSDKKISQLPQATELQGGELFVLAQSDITKQTTLNEILNYLVPTNLTVSAGQTVNLSEATYDNSMLIRLTWSGANGTVVLNLPSASDNTNRVMRFISNGGFATATRVELTPIGGDELDGSTLPYVINKVFEGIQVWSDGVEWFIIQKKA